MYFIQTCFNKCTNDCDSSEPQLQDVFDYGKSCQRVVLKFGQPFNVRHFWCQCPQFTLKKNLSTTKICLLWLCCQKSVKRRKNLKVHVQIGLCRIYSIISKISTLLHNRIALILLRLSMKPVFLTFSIKQMTTVPSK